MTMNFEDFEMKTKYRIKKMYDRQSFPADAPSPIDLLGDERLYGKVDKMGNAVSLMVKGSDSLSEVRGSGNVKLINFVARAFSDLKWHYESLIAKRSIHPVMDMGQLSPVLGWVDFSALHRESLARFREFVMNMCIGKYDRSIRNFGDFVKVCFRIMFDSKVRYVVTKTGNLVSDKTPNRTSGLVVNLLPYSNSDEEMKIRMISSPHFVGFVNLCGQYGFRVNKSAPWVLAANLSSEILSNYADVSGVSTTPNGGDFFEKFYMKTHLEDLDFIRSFFVSLYNDFVEYRPILRVLKTTNGNVEEWKYRRQPMQDPGEYDIRFWIEMLFKLRLMETDLFDPVDQYIFDETVEELLRIYNLHGIEVTLNHLNHEVKTRDYHMNVYSKYLKNVFTSHRIGHIMLSIHKK